LDELETTERPGYLPILNIFVPQVEHVPVVAGLPFFIVMAVGLFISFFALHLTQYASIFSDPFPSCRGLRRAVLTAEAPPCKELEHSFVSVAGIPS
jgi:hypothetical protein